jgi:hypothetical protein
MPFAADNAYPYKNPGSSDHFDKSRQFLTGIEIYPFAGRVQIGHAPVSLALNPYQILVNWNLPTDLAGFHWYGIRYSACLIHASGNNIGDPVEDLRLRTAPPYAYLEMGNGG